KNCAGAWSSNCRVFDRTSTASSCRTPTTVAGIGMGHSRYAGVTSCSVVIMADLLAIRRRFSYLILNPLEELRTDLPRCLMKSSFHWQHPAFTRRTAIQAGVVGLLGLGMDDLQALRAISASDSGKSAKARTVIYIFLSGGLSQIDSFDLKPEAPAEFRGEFKPIGTKTP